MGGSQLRWVWTGIALVLGNSFARAEEPPPPGTFTLVLLPDTQTYAVSYPQVFEAQTQWIRDHREAHGIEYVLHLGDITYHNTLSEWNVARGALATLDGEVPYALATGNHDYGSNGGSQDRTTYFNDPAYFGLGSPYARQPSLGGFYESALGRTDNSFHLFSAQGRDWIILALEWGPRDDVLEWAAGVLEAYPGRTPLVITHAYMYADETRYDWEVRGTAQSWNPYQYGTALLPGGANDGQDIWNKLVSPFDVPLVFSGHVLFDGTGRQASLTRRGRVSYQMLSNYQGEVEDVPPDNGYLRLLQFLPDGETIRVRTYSPYWDQSRDELDHRFAIGLAAESVPSDPRVGVTAGDPLLYWELERAYSSDVMNLGIRAGGLDGNYTGPGPTAADFVGGLHEVQSRERVSLLENWSILAWARSDSDAPQTVLSNDRDGWNNDVLFGLSPDPGYTASGRWGASHHDEDTQKRTVVEAPYDAVPGRWYQLALVSDGRTLGLYVDGELVAEAPRAGGDLSLGSHWVRVGRSFNSNLSGRPFHGKIAEVALYPRAISVAEVVQHRLASMQRVTGRRITAEGPTDPNTNATLVTSRWGGAFPGLEVGLANEGDIAIATTGGRVEHRAVEGRVLDHRDGILLASITENDRSGYQGSVEVAHSAFGDGAMALSITEAGYVPGGAGTNEINMNTGVAWFPFYAGWQGAHVAGSGTLQGGHGVEPEMVTRVDVGRYEVELGEGTVEGGMLFTVGAANGDNLAPTGHLPSRPPGGSPGWDVRVHDNAWNFSETGEDSGFSFVYVPYDTPGLVGGHYDGGEGKNLVARGNFELESEGAGVYRLRIPGQSSSTGQLMMQVCNRVSSGGIEAPDDNFLSYEDQDDGSFLIQSRDVPNSNLQHTRWIWAFIPWQGWSGPRYSVSHLVAGEEVSLCVTQGGGGRWR